MHKYIALLRGINVSGRNRISMDELRRLCGALGWQDVQTYIQSGNVIFRPGPDEDPAILETGLGRAIEARFGFSVPVIVRPATAWDEYFHGNPFGAEVQTEPERVLLGLSQRPPAPETADVLQGRGAAGERVRFIGDAIWIHYPEGIARSKLTPALLDRVVGSPVTTRNWRTVVKLAGLVGPPALP